ncbi:hypothetical protein MCOR14_006617 [Pyricularia oryzae]|nr:hypothetical protein MCOR30_005255 [Pyricularia oryzae]KAI6633598.1 hypothetical protein MCOR14_006617 [Pyricularia oryzae]
MEQDLTRQKRGQVNKKKKNRKPEKAAGSPHPLHPPALVLPERMQSISFLLLSNPPRPNDRHSKKNIGALSPPHPRRANTPSVAIRSKPPKPDSKRIHGISSEGPETVAEPQTALEYILAPRATESRVSNLSQVGPTAAG